LIPGRRQLDRLGGENKDRDLTVRDTVRAWRRRKRSVEENLETGFAALPRDRRSIPSETYDLFPVLKSMLKRRDGDLSGGQQQQFVIGRALVTRDLANGYAVMDRGEIVLSGRREDMDEAKVRRYLTDWTGRLTRRGALRAPFPQERRARHIRGERRVRRANLSGRPP
jgi:hypothetical protein